MTEPLHFMATALSWALSWSKERVFVVKSEYCKSRYKNKLCLKHKDTFMSHSQLDPNMWHILGAQNVWKNDSLKTMAFIYFLHVFTNILINLFILIGGKCLYNIVMAFAIHWHESPMGAHVPPSWNPSQLPPYLIPLSCPRALAFECPASCFELGLVVYLTYFSAILSYYPTLAFSHIVQKSVLYICVSFAVLHMGPSLLSF